MQNSWREIVINQVDQIFESDQTVLAVFIYGSGAFPDTMDEWSDIDLMMIVDDRTFQKTTAFSRFQNLGETFSVVHEEASCSKTTRICFKGLGRIDLTVHPQSWLESKPSFYAYDVIKSRIPIDAVNLLRNKEEIPPSESTEEEVNHFCHKAQLAIVKLMRNDVLISSHLTLDLFRDALVQVMKTRDSTEGTQHHRFGGLGNDQTFSLMEKIKGTSKTELLESIRFIGTWYLSSVTDSGKLESLCEMIEMARGHLHALTDPTLPRTQNPT